MSPVRVTFTHRSAPGWILGNTVRVCYWPHLTVWKILHCTAAVLPVYKHILLISFRTQAFTGHIFITELIISEERNVKREKSFRLKDLNSVIRQHTKLHNTKRWFRSMYQKVSRIAFPLVPVEWGNQHFHSFSIQVSHLLQKAHITAWQNLSISEQRCKQFQLTFLITAITHYSNVQQWVRV